MSRQNREEMIARVGEWQRSSMSASAFAQTLGISKTTFDYWIRKVREVSRTSGDTPAFIEIQPSVLPKPLVEAKSHVVISANPQIVLTFPSGLCVKIFG
jgi:transposase-like protein